jgi:hypothetical protein
MIGDKYCFEINVLWSCLVGLFLAAALYWFCAWLKKVPPHFVLWGEAMSLGALLFGALHLLYAAFCPINLVEVYDQNNKLLHPPEIRVGEETSENNKSAIRIAVHPLHFFELIIGGLFVLYLPSRGLKHICQNPANP